MNDWRCAPRCVAGPALAARARDPLQPRVGAAEEQQRRHVLCRARHRQRLADHDHVIAASWIALTRQATVASASGRHGRPVFISPRSCSLKSTSRGRACSPLAAKRSSAPLALGEDADREARGRAHGGERLAVVREAHEQQRRLERHGGDGVDGRGDRAAVAAARADDAHAGGEVAHDGAHVVLGAHASSGPRSPRSLAPALMRPAPACARAAAPWRACSARTPGATSTSIGTWSETSRP